MNTTSKCDPQVGISSFNNSETISSCLLWRKKMVNKEAASSFRTSGSLAAACLAIRRRSIILNRQLGVKNETGNPKTTAKNISDDDFSAIHELIRLVGNVTFFDVLCRLTVKDADVIQHLGTLLEFNDLRLDIASSIMRLFGNLCEAKESAASVLQTKPCVRVIVRWLTKNLDQGIEQDSTSNDSTSTKRDVAISASTELLKLREQTVRSLRNAAACGKNLAHYLIRSETVCGVGRLIRLLNIDGQKKTPSKTLYDTAFHFLQLLLTFRDHGYSQQILRADIFEKLMELCRADEHGAPVKLVLGMVTHYSSLRCELSKFGAIEWIQERVEKQMATEGWANEIIKHSMDGSSDAGESLVALIRFCRDAYTRAKLREFRTLDLLLNIFIKGELKETRIFHELMAAFLCFLYDDQGLKYLVEYDGFLDNVTRVLDHFVVEHPCSAPHSHAEGDEIAESKATAASVDATLCEFRADSPSYKRFRLDPAALSTGADGDPKSYEGPLCKDFTAAVVHSNWSSPSMSPFRSMPSPSSPGPSWSPSASSQSFSSIGSTSPPSAEKDNASSCWSPTSETGRSSDDLEHDYWMDYERRRPSAASEKPAALCECELPSGDNSDIFKNRERLLWAAVKLLSWLSHSVHASLLVNVAYLTSFLSYVAGVCRPEPRVGRLIERLARNRLFTESLLALQFHESVTDILCSPKCHGTNKACCRCRKLGKIGSGIMNSFGAQVDTDFGFGTLEHMISMGDEKRRIKCLCAMLYLMRSNWRVKRMMSGEGGGFQTLVNVIAGNDADEATRMTVMKALYAAMNKDDLRERFSTRSTAVITSNVCVLPHFETVDEENRVTFMENDGGVGRIECDIRLLVASSPFYRAMFSGSYSESKLRHFVYDDGGEHPNFAAFVFYVHFLHGCKNCDRSGLRSASECLAVLDLADKRLCCALGEFVVSEIASIFLRSDNVQEFISNSILRRDFLLHKLCMDYMFAFCTAHDFLHISAAFKASDLRLEFFMMLTNYLKNQFGYE